MSFRIHFHDVPHSEKVREACEGLADGVRTEFPEVHKVEVSITEVHGQREVHVHASGKGVDFASSVTGESIGRAFDKVRRQLRTHHDKRIAAHRRGRASHHEPVDVETEPVDVETEPETEEA